MRFAPSKELLIRSLTIAALAVYPAFALGADQAPNMKGKWVGKTHTIVAGKGGHWTTISGSNEKTDEPFIGELTGEDNETVVMADTDGYFTGTLVDDNELSFCYMQAGGKTESSVVSCTEVKRTP